MTTPSSAAWLWDKFGSQIVTSAVQGLWQGFRWIEAANNYCDNLYERYKTIQIFGQPEPVSLEGIFTHVRLLDEPTAFQRYDFETLQAAAENNPFILHHATRQSIETVELAQLINLPEANRLFILGKPGAGKSTLLQYLVLQATKGKLDKLPILVNLREWYDIGDYQRLLDFIALQFDICRFPEARPVVDYLLRHVNTLVLFDGLDEIPQAGKEINRDKATIALQNLAEKYPRAQILITCRVAASHYTFRGFKYVEVADFNLGQMHAFVRKWFREDKDLAKQFWQEFVREESDGLRELGRVPLLLALLCLGYSKTRTFPRRHVELYEEALDALLQQWDESRNIQREEIYQTLSLDLKHQLLAKLAATYFQEGQYFFKEDDIAARIVTYLDNISTAPSDQRSDKYTADSKFLDLNGSRILRAIETQHGVLVERARHIHTFAHLTFQEYYTARYVVENVTKGTIQRLMTHIDDDRWREVFLLVASLLPQADCFFEEFQQALDKLVQHNKQVLDLSLIHI